MQLKMTQKLDAQILIHVTLSCISYLRDLFNENCFENDTFCNVTIKSLKRGMASSSDKLMDWLEKGCYDAISKKYLKTLTVGIYLKENSPTKVSEIYTFDIKYDKEENHNAETISKLIRTLCLLTQSLQALPSIKYLTLKLLYNKNTPSNYEPEYFKPAGKHEFEFVSEPLRLDVGRATVDRTETLLKVFTLFDFSKKNDQDVLNQEGPPIILSTPKEHNKVDINEKLVESKNDDLSSVEIEEKEKKTNIKCICTIYNEEKDMLKCDRCLNMLHTVCCGFFSNNDKRIPKDKFICDVCKKNETLDDLFLISNQRKVLSVIYNEGLTTRQQVAKRLNLSKPLVQKIIKQFIAEGFIIGHFNRIEVIRNNDTKMMIKNYFSITNIEERSSIPISDIKCVRSD